MHDYRLHPAQENATLVRLASRRYPDDSPLLAVEFLLSDRREAGLGALDERKRLASRRHSPVRNTKTQDLMTGRWHYSRRIDIPPRVEWPPLEADDLLPGSGATIDKVTIRRIPARQVHMACYCERPRTEADRRMVAAMLRELRRSTRV